MTLVRLMVVVCVIGLVLVLFGCSCIGVANTCIVVNDSSPSVNVPVTIPIPIVIPPDTGVFP